MNQTLTDLVEEILAAGVQTVKDLIDGYPQTSPEKIVKEYTDKLAAAVEDVIGPDENPVVTVTETTHPGMATGIHNDKPAKIRNALRKEQRERLYL